MKVYKVERWCAMVGGICVEKHECAEGQLASKSGLCPQNKHLGVECCYEGKQLDRFLFVKAP